MTRVALDVDQNGAIAATECDFPVPPIRCTRRASARPATLGDGYFGDWHMLLAFLAGEPDPLAGRALEACGLTHAHCAAWIASHDFFPPARPKPRDPSGAAPP